MEELNKRASEFNFVPNEENKIEIVNEKKYFEKFDEDNKNLNLKKDTKRAKNKLQIKLFSGFMVLCAAVSVLQIGVNIPVFNDIFNPSPQAPSPSAPVKPVVPVVPEGPTFSFDSVVAKDYEIDFSFTIANVDLEKEEYCFYLVRRKNATDEYLSSIPEDVKKSNELKIIKDTDDYNLKTHLTSNGGMTLTPETDYTIVLVNNEKIVSIYDITTDKKVYIKNCNVFFGKSTINVSLTPDESFVAYDTVLVRVENLTDKAWGPENNGVEFTTFNEQNISYSTACFNVSQGKTKQYFEVKVYCIARDPEKIALPDTITHGDDINPEYFYLIYTYDKPIILEGV